MAAANMRSGRMQIGPFAKFAGIGIVLAAAGAFALVAVGLKPLPAYLAALNLVALLLYGYDKIMATTGRFRVPEGVLHLVALAGGAPGALAGQKLFRHKTRKGRFQLVFWRIVALQLALIVWRFAS